MGIIRVIQYLSNNGNIGCTGSMFFQSKHSKIIATVAHSEAFYFAISCSICSLLFPLVPR